MEAVMLSLKDLEVHHPETEPQSTSADTSDTLESSPKDSLHASPVVDKCNSAKSEITPSSSVEHSVPQKEVTSPSLRNDFDLSSQQPSPDSSISSAEPPSDTSLSATSSRSDSTSVQSSSDTADVSNNTKATLTIERSPSGHIMEGLMRRWEFGFFRNNRWGTLLFFAEIRHSMYSFVTKVALGILMYNDWSNERNRFCEWCLSVTIDCFQLKSYMFHNYCSFGKGM